jgi:hypothetical protein
MKTEVTMNLFYMIRGREVLDAHGHVGDRIRIRVAPHDDGIWRHSPTGERIAAQWDVHGEWTDGNPAVVIVTDNPNRAPFLPDEGECERIGMTVEN